MAWDLLDIEDLIDVCASKAMAWVFIMGSRETLLVLISGVQSFGDFFFLIWFDLFSFPDTLGSQTVERILQVVPVLEEKLD